MEPVRLTREDFSEVKKQIPESFQTVNKLRPLDNNERKKALQSFRESHGGVGTLRKAFQNERLKNPIMQTEEMSILEHTLDYLSRGNYMAAEQAMGLLEGDNINNLWERSKAGLKGEAKTSFIDVMNKINPSGNPYLNVGIGFAGDVVLDYTNLIPWSWPRKVGELLKLPEIIRAADDITKVSKLVKKTGQVMGDLPGIRHAGMLLKPGYKLRKLPGAFDLVRDLHNKVSFIRYNAQVQLEKRWDLFRKVSKKLGVDSEWAIADMVRAHQAGELNGIDKINDLKKALRIDETLADPESMGVLKDIYNEVVSGLDDLFEKETKAGLLSPKSYKENYFPHIYEEGKIKLTKGGKFEVKGQHGFFTSLKYRTNKPFYTKAKEFKTIEDAKLWIAEKALKGYPVPVPVEHWLRGYAIRRFVGESALAWRGFIDESLSKFAKPIEQMVVKGEIGDVVPKGYSLVMPTMNLSSPQASKLIEKMFKEGLSKAPGEAEKFLAEQGPNILYELFKSTKGSGLVMDVSPELIKKLSGKGVYMMPTELAEHIRDSFKVFGSEETTRGFLGVVDTAFQWWKTMATSMRIPFHARNALSNLWQMYIGGVKVPMMSKRIFQAGRVQLQDKGFEFLGWSAKELDQLANRYGVRAFGWMASDQPKLFQKELFIASKRSAVGRKLGLGVNPLNPLETVSRVGRKVGTQVEDNARIALFLNELKKMGLSKGNATKEQLFEASMKVKKYLFDYTELTPFERKIMKKVFPFYTWMRKNIPLQLESIVRRPEKFARLADVERDLYPIFTEPETPQEKAIRPKWLDEMRARKIKNWTTKEGDPIYFWIDLPTSDLHKMSKLGKYLMSSINPAFILLDTARNVRGWPFAGKLGEPGQKMVAPFYVQFLPQKDWEIMGIEPIREPKTGKTVLGIDPKWKYALNTALPFLNDWEAMHPGGVNLGVVKEGETLPRVISYFSGIKFKPIRKSDAARQRYYRTQDAVKNIKRAAKSQLKLTPEERDAIFRKSLE